MIHAEALPAVVTSRASLGDAGPAAGASQRAATLDRLANLWRAGDIADQTTIDCHPSGFAALDAELPGKGWPGGQLIELLLDSPGIGELGLLMPALARLSRQQRSSVWVLPAERPATAVDGTMPYPPALAAAGVDLARCLFVRPAAPRESFWALEQALRASHLGAVIGWVATGTPEGDFRALRRLQLLAGRHRALVFVLRDLACASAPSPAALRLRLAGEEGQLRVQILKRRGRPLLQPIALQLQPPHWCDARVAAVADPVSERPVPESATIKATLPAKRWSLAAIFSH